ncbi:PEP-CTERM-box response regulator transcription factor [Mangrovimicrobium sediminis]|uniref:PEP-CTERM-box response regulator transcription factor n=1 Tax=Mangrovimicrobium sediminis TaxID=2562682 RepID=A0A4Z0LXH5_9GAMM|nr:PEP-CTERM-box response regulator transcription factor [Haliea sp. SAOS-164]TGD71866.1 PEP-CTERM-box response regulator transcription factor [Haliea sp. SAOS-164]
MADDRKCLLVVEDDRGLQNQLRWAFEDYAVALAGNRDEAIAILRREQPGVVLLDLGLPPDPGGVSEGFATLREILSLAPETRIVVVTGDNDRANAIEAISLGAYDFYQKPVDPEVLGLIVERAYRVYELEAENKRLQLNQKESPLEGVIASSPQMLEVCRMVERVAPVDITVLLLGASGTGKERIAQAIHARSPRGSKNIVAINCAAIPDTLLESELFGHEKGAFTGATSQHIGKIERAHGGTLFLDEIGDLPLELQAKLLRFLQERVVERVGGRKEIPVDTRIICATHQNVLQMIENKTFREDLYYRISEISIRIPPLRERDGDAVLLAKAFLERFNQELGGPRRVLGKDAIEAIEAYAWPGNVRELESKIKRAMIISDNGQIAAADLELADVEGEPLPINLKQVREDAERRVVWRALVQCDHNISDAAQVLGVTRPTLYKLLEKYQLR